MSSKRTQRRRDFEAKKYQEFLVEDESDSCLHDLHDLSEDDVDHEIDGRDFEMHESVDDDEVGETDAESSSYSGLSFCFDTDEEYQLTSSDEYEEEPNILPLVEEQQTRSFTLKEKLVLWHLTERPKQKTCDSLLKLLNPYHPELPLTARTLVETPRHVNIQDMSPGIYHHFGLIKSIRQALFPFKPEDLSDTLNMLMGSDGISMAKSSGSQFYAIVGYFPQLQSEVFEIAVYHGYSKPHDANAFFQQTITEAKQLYEEGMEFKGKRIRVVIGALVADAPLRAWATCTKSHSSKLDGCGPCTGNGVSFGVPRTNESFRQQRDRSHHHRHSIFENLVYFDLVRDVPLDAMHLFDFGLMKRMFDYLMRTKYPIPNVTLSPGILRQFDASFQSLNPFISRVDFARQPRSIKELPRWKSAEFRQVLLYTGVVIFKKYLSSAFYLHFLHLHYAVKLLSSSPWYREDNETAFQLIQRFILKAPELYTDKFVCYNLHAAYHVPHQSLHHGPIYGYSAYIMENHYGHMKHYLAKNDLPLSQLVKRIYERWNAQELLLKYRIIPNPLVQLSIPHTNGPTINNFSGQQFKKATKYLSWQLSCVEPDNCVYLRDLSIVLIVNFVVFNGKNVLIGRRFLNQTDHNKDVIPSSVVCEYLVSNLSPRLEAWELSQVKWKGVKLPANFPQVSDYFVVLPLSNK